MKYFNIFLFILMNLMSNLVFIESENSLCQNPTVFSADRFNNQTVRLFRENNTWDLEGFPDNTRLEPMSEMKNYWFLHPVNKTARMVTVLEGAEAIKDRTFKFDGLFWWSWYNHPKFGLRYVATSVGLYWKEIPRMGGFAAVFHNGDKDDPMLIGLEANTNFSDKHMKIHYFSTENETFFRKSSQYYDEKDFPIDMTDAFSWSPTDGSKYVVYILKADKYCRLSDKQKCSEWKPNKELFGCEKSPPEDKVPEETPEKTPEETPEETPKGTPEETPEETSNETNGPGIESTGKSKNPDLPPNGETPENTGTEDPLALSKEPSNGNTSVSRRPKDPAKVQDSKNMDIRFTLSYVLIVFQFFSIILI